MAAPRAGFDLGGDTPPRCDLALKRQQVFRTSELSNMLELAFDAAGERLVVRKQERGPTSTVSVYQWRPQALLHEVANRLDANMGQRTWEELLPGVQFPTTFSELPISFEIAVNGVAISEGPILPILPKWTIGTFFCGMFAH